MVNSIDWKQITPRMKVVLVTGKHADRHGHKNQWYEAAGKLVTFSGTEQLTAQRFLSRRANADKKR